MSVWGKLKNVGQRFLKSNNRSLGTVGGCLVGFIIGLVCVIQETANLPIIGALTSSSAIPYQIIGVLLATGVGGNLSSYIGATIDIITGDKTLFDLFKRKPVDSAVNPASLGNEPVNHFPFLAKEESLSPEQRQLREERVTHNVQVISDKVNLLLMNKKVFTHRRRNVVEGVQQSTLLSSVSASRIFEVAEDISSQQSSERMLENSLRSIINRLDVLSDNLERFKSKKKFAQRGATISDDEDDRNPDWKERVTDSDQKRDYGVS